MKPVNTNNPKNKYCSHCEHCDFAFTRNCRLKDKETNYWNRCKDFEWRHEYLQSAKGRYRLMSRVDDALSIARLHKSQAEADVLRDMYFTENPSVIIEFCDAVIDLLEKQPKWIPVEERLPENAQHKGAHCPRYKVYTKWGETEGWYNPDKGCWYFLLWYFGEEGVDFERGDYPKLAHEINGAKVVTHWMPLSEPPKEGEI